MNYAEQFLELFKGSDVTFGHAKLTGVVRSNGKREAKHGYCHRLITVSDWEKHLDGKQGIGCVPINSQSMVRGRFGR